MQILRKILLLLLVGRFFVNSFLPAPPDAVFMMV